MGGEKILVVLGPTAVGKTPLGVKLAKAFGGEVISGDSRQVYRGMNIGTAKPTPAELGGVPHHLLDILDPIEAYSVASFQRAAIAAAKEIAGRGKLPILVGGTGLYIRAFIRGFNFTPAGPEPGERRRLLADLEAMGSEEMHKRLLALDPARAAVLHPRDWRRIVRAHETVGISPGPGVMVYDPLQIGLDLPRAILYRRIELRVDQMIQDGLVEEVQGLMARGYGAVSPAFDSIGYREIVRFLGGEGSLAEAVERIKLNTRHFAKRQLTWFRRENDLNWLPAEPDPEKAACDLVAKWLSKGVK